MTTPPEPQALFSHLFDPSTRANPYPHYKELRERGPLQMLASDRNLIVFSSFHDCDEVLRHPAACSEGLQLTAVQRAIAAGEEKRVFAEQNFLFLDPPEHTRLRNLVSKAFSPKVVKALEPFITALVSSLLDPIAEQGRFDVIADLAYPLPVAVICRLLGVPIENEPEFSRASAIAAQSLDPFITGDLSDWFDERMRVGLWLREFLTDLIEQRRAKPRDDLISELIAVEESGDRLTEEEILVTCNLLLMAGHETTVSLIANAILAMLRHRGQWAALSSNPARAAVVVEETLRYDPPVQLMGRTAAEDMTIGEVSVAKGDTMMLLIAAAHRDPDVIEWPDEFDPDRRIIRHLAFGYGRHFCMGAPLARLGASIALSALAVRFPHARLDGEPAYKPNMALRGLSTLTVTV